MRWMGYAARMVEMRNLYKILAGKLEGKRPSGKQRRRCVVKFEMD
jgi:hypothetical protein